jgi:TPR repeat protein
MGTTGKIAVVTLALAGFGALRMPMEENLTRDFRDHGLLPHRIDLDTRQKLDQTAAMVAFGGLRTLIAAILNLRAFGFFERQDWCALEETYDTILTLAPDTVFYWDIASWHLAYNAAADYLEREDIPPLRRRQLWRDSIQRGISILENGIRNNPDDWSLSVQLAHIYDNPFKLRDYPEAERWYTYAIQRGAPSMIRRFRLFAMARIPGREKETLALARKLHAIPANRTPTLNCILFVSEYRADPNQSLDKLIGKIFENRHIAWRQLRTYYNGIKDMPTTGVHAALCRLRKQIIPVLENAALRNPDNWAFAKQLADIYSTPFDAPDYPQAERWYAYAVGHGAPDFVRRSRLFAMARIPGREKETLDLARKLHANPKIRTPALDCLLFAAEHRADPNQPLDALTDKIFATPEAALRQLEAYRKNHETLPMDGVEAALRRLRQ